MNNTKKLKTFLQMSRAWYLAVLILTLSGATVIAQTNQTAELTVDKAWIYPDSLTYSLPLNGMPVDRNPPFLFCPIQSGDNTYFFRLSQDPNFTSGVISNSHFWSFYSPYQPLALGTWYWQYAWRLTNSVTAPVWSQTQTFTIGADARIVSTPPVSVLEAGLVSNGYPRFVCHGAAELGNLWPQDAALRLDLSNQVVAALRLSSPTMSQAVHAYALMTNATSWNFMTNTFAEVTSAFEAGDHPSTGWDWLFYQDDFASYYDVAQANLSSAEREALRSKGIAAVVTTYNHLLNWLDNDVMDEHRWQVDVRTLLIGALVFYDPADSRTKNALEYIYDLWNFRAPIGGRDDGGWANGTGYADVHMDSLFSFPLMLGRHTGYDFFCNTAWYSNVSRFSCYCALPGHPGGAYGDRDDIYVYSHPFSHLSKCMMVATQSNPYDYRSWTEYQTQYTGSQIFNGFHWEYLPLLKNKPLPVTNQPVIKLERGAIFRDTGMVLLHNNPDDPTSTVRVMMRSCPRGTVGHGHAANNAFNLTYGGEKLFFKTGYYWGGGSFQASDYEHSRAQNTILPSGNVGQSISTSGWGWMPRMVYGDQIGYCLGDASHSYGTKITRFRRHIALLVEGTVVIYDELEAPSAIPWTFRLNAVNPIVKINSHTVATSSSKGLAVAELFCNDPVQTAVTDQFTGDYKDLASALSHVSGANEWHVNMGPTNALQKTRFLTLIHRVALGQAAQQRVESVSGAGRKVVSANGWNVEAQMDGNQPSYLKIWNDAGTAALVSGQAATQLQLGSTNRVAQLPGSTLLMEQGANGVKVQEEVDVLPNVLRYGNLY